MSFSRLVGLVARRDYLRTVRRRGFVFGTLLLPLSIVLYVIATPMRRRARRRAQAQADARSAADPHGGAEPPGDAVSPIGKEP